MTGWLRNRTHEQEAAPLRPDIAAMLPPSVRPPDSNRFMPLGSDAPEEVDDEDLAFLTTLANEVDRATAPKRPAPLTETPLRGANSRIDDMQVFREMKDEGKQTTRYDHHLRNVDMADLLEELSDVQAALRQRRVA